MRNSSTIDTEGPSYEDIDWLADLICKKGLTTIALFFLEMSRPFTTVLANVVLFVLPPTYQLNNRLVNCMNQVVGDRKKLEHLIQVLEERQ